MNVRELIAALQDFDGEMEVHFQYNYGDHWRTQVAPAVSDVAEGMVKDSAYHNMPKVVDEDAEEDRDGVPGGKPEGATTVVLIS